MNLFKAMRLFVRIVGEGSLSGAAAEHDLSPTMVGNHLRALEAHVGMKLLNRTTRRQQLTEFGQLYYERCVEILALVGDAQALARESQQVPRGRLRLSAPDAFGIDQLTPALVDYRRRYPEVTVDLAITDQRVDLLDDRIEAAVRIGALASFERDADLVARPLAPLRLVICAAPAYVAEHGEPARKEDLASHRCLIHADAQALDWQPLPTTWQLRGPAGEVALSVHGVLRVDSAQALRQAALSGWGLALLPYGVVESDVSQGRLLPLLADWPPAPRPLHLLYRRDRRMSPKLRSFIDFVLERFGPKD